MIKKRVTLVALSFLFAHDPNNQKIILDDFIRIGFVSNVQIEQNGLGSHYRLKRITKNTFRDLKMYAHFFDSLSEIKMRIKSSNKYDFNPNLYHFTTYNYHKSGNNLRYHFNQGVGALLKNSQKGNFTSEIGWAYDKSDFIDSDEKTTYLKSAVSFDRNFEKLKMKLELEYYHQISELLIVDLSRFETNLEFQYKINKYWDAVFSLDREVYTESKNQFRSNPTTIFISLNRKGFFN